MPQEFHSSKIVTQNCIHSKQVFSLLDVPQNEDIFKRLNKHVDNCLICSEEFKKIQLKAMASKVFIPKAVMDRDLRQSFEREVGELFNVMELNDRQILKKNVKKGFRFIDSMGIDFIKNLASPTMIKAYLFAMVLFVTLKHFF